MENLKNSHHPDSANRSPKGGFSIIELVFAMSFLTIIILGVVSLQTSNLVMMSGQQNQIQAQFLANQGLQIAKAIGYGPIKAEFLGCTDPLDCYRYLKLDGGSYDLSGTSEEVTRGNQTFNRKIQILAGLSDEDGTIVPLASGIKIKAIIEWEDATGPHFKDEIDPDTGQSMNSHVESSLIIY